MITFFSFLFLIHYLLVFKFMMWRSASTYILWNTHRNSRKIKDAIILKETVEHQTHSCGPDNYNRDAVSWIVSCQRDGKAGIGYASCCKHGLLLKPFSTRASALLCDLLLIMCITTLWRQCFFFGRKKRGIEDRTGKRQRQKKKKKTRPREPYLWKARGGGRVGGGGGSCYRLWCFIHFMGFCMGRQMWTCVRI